jgi:hypothetical protein
MMAFTHGFDIDHFEQNEYNTATNAPMPRDGSHRKIDRTFTRRKMAMPRSKLVLSRAINRLMHVSTALNRPQV